MPRKAVDFTKACVYKICCKNITIKDVYVGSTTNLAQRRSNHKSDCTKPDNKGHNVPVYQFIRENGGWDNWEVIKIEDCPCVCDEDLRRRERHWLESLQATLNCQNPFTGFATREEYCKAYNKEYGKEHKTEISARKSEKVTCEHCQSVVSKRNLSAHRKTAKCRNDEIPAKLKKVSCEYCQCVVVKKNLDRHQKTAKCRRARGID
jgi:hypothetical protein